jgi:protein O-mannosyl-transferase
LLTGLGMGLITIWWERYHQGTSRALFTFLSPLERVLIASRAVWFYLSKLIWPSNLTFIYPRWTVSSAHLINYFWLLAAVALCAAICFVRRYVGRSVEVAAVFFAATLSPVLGFIMLYTFRYTFVADHYQYLACVGPIALVSAGVATLAKPLKTSRPLILSGAWCAVAVLAVLTWRQSAMYGDIEALWRTTLARNPGCWMAHNNLGIVLFQKGETDEAIAHYQATLEMQPDFWDADYNLGNALLQKGEVNEAIVYCNRAVEGEPNDPDAQVSLGDALSQKGQLDEAVVHYEKALTIRPQYLIAHYRLGNALLQKGDIDAAIFHCRAALSIQPEHAGARINLAVALDQKGQVADAIANYEKALTIFPESIPALNNLAWLLATGSEASLRNGNRALELARRADQLSSGANLVVRRTLAAAYAELGEFAKATEIAQGALSQAEAQGDTALVTELKAELVTYQTGSPYREMSD